MLSIINYDDASPNQVDDSNCVEDVEDAEDVDIEFRIGQGVDVGIEDFDGDVDDVDVDGDVDGDVDVDVDDVDDSDSDDSDDVDHYSEPLEYLVALEVTPRLEVRTDTQRIHL